MSNSDGNRGKIFAGIDLGSMNSCIAIYKNDTVDVISGADGSRITQSFVYYDDNDKAIVGKMRKILVKSILIVFFMRLIGSKSKDEVCKKFKDQWTFETTKLGYCKYKLDGKEYTPEEVAAQLIKKLVSYVNEKIDGVVITVPAYFTLEQKARVMEAGKLAGIEVFQLLCEPTAAAIAYGMEHSYANNEILFVFDMGGGTFDITVIRVANSMNFDVIAVGGHPCLGGRDFDCLITNWMMEMLRQKVGDGYVLAARKKLKMMEMAKDAKEALSQAEDAILQLGELHPEAEDVVLTRKIFIELSQGLITQIKDIITSTLRLEALDKKEIDHVLFVGGASKIFIINKILKEFFNESKFSKTVNPEEIVALGATRMAASIGKASTKTEIKDLRITDALSTNIGFETLGQLGRKFEIVFPENSPYNVSKPIKLKTTIDFQTKTYIAFYEGHSLELGENVMLGSLIITNLPSKKAGEVEISVILKINQNGTLEVEANGPGDCFFEYENISILKKS